MYISFSLNFLYLLGGLDDKEPSCNAGDLSLIPGLERYPGGGHGNHFSIFVWRIFMNRGAGKATVCRVAKSWTLLSN